MFKQESFDKYTFETSNFKVVFEISFEQESNDSLMQDWDEKLKKETLLKIKNGDMHAYSFAVKVIHKPTDEELSSSYLGGSFYEDPKDFMDHYGLGITSLERNVKKQRGRNRKLTQNWIEFYHKNGYTPVGSYFKDMVKEAIQEARTVYNMECVKLKQA